MPVSGITGISQPNVLKHLAKLRDIGLVKDERKEQYSFYSLNIKDQIIKEYLKIIFDNIEDYLLFKIIY